MLMMIMVLTPLLTMVIMPVLEGVLQPHAVSAIGWETWREPALSPPGHVPARWRTSTTLENSCRRKILREPKKRLRNVTKRRYAEGRETF